LSFFPVTIAGRRDEADGIISLEVVSADGTPLPPWAAGAHVDVDCGATVRQYSLCNDPQERGRYRLGILREPASRGGSSAIHDTFHIGRTIMIGPPRNTFALREDARASILLAGGIGVTPLLAMAYRLHGLGADFHLHYCTRTPARTAFAGELAQAAFADRVHVHHDDGAPQQLFDFDRALPPAAPDIHLYVCGPGGFMDFVTGAARRTGWPEDQIHLEYFSNDRVDVAGGAFSVTLARSGRTLSVPPEKTILHVLQENGISVPISCEQGVCGTCLTAVIEGRPDHRDLYQTDAEKAANTHITVCCSRAHTPSLVLDL